MLAFYAFLLFASVALAAPVEHKKRNFGRVTFYRIKDSNPHFACGGYYTSEDDHIVALSTHGDFSMDKCGQSITVNYQGKTVTATIQDGCETCDPGEIDLSPGAMSKLDSDYQNTGQFNAEWSYGGGGGGDSAPKQDENKDQPAPEPSSSSSSSETPSPTPSPTPETTSTSTSTTSTTPTTSSTSTTPSTTSTTMSSTTMSSSTMSITTNTTSTNTTLSHSSTMLSSSAVSSSTAPISSDHVIAGSGPRESGNLAGVGDLVVSFGRLVALAAGGV